MIFSIHIQCPECGCVQHEEYQPLLNEREQGFNLRHTCIGCYAILDVTPMVQVMGKAVAKKDTSYHVGGCDR